MQGYTMAKPKASDVIAVVSDVHWLGDREPHPSWVAFRRWAADVEPSLIVCGGDLLDFGHLSPYEDTAFGQGGAVAQIQQGVRELNALAKHSRVMVQLGNHEERWAKVLLGGKLSKFEGALGLSLWDQFKAQGLSPKVEEAPESVYLGRDVARTLVRHGHLQSGKYGAKHLAANMIAKCPHVNSVHGHHHRADFFIHTSQERSVWGIANPCLSPTFKYSNGGDVDWQRGFTTLEFWAGGSFVTPTVVVMSDACSFAWRGRVYEGT